MNSKSAPESVKSPPPRCRLLFCATLGRPGGALKMVVAVCAALLAAGHCSAEPSEPPPPAPKTLRVMFFNTENYRPSPDGRFKSRDSLQAVADTIVQLNPDIAVLAEIADQEALKDLLRRMGSEAADRYPYTHVVNAADSFRKLVMLARFHPVEEKHDTSTTYTIKDNRVPVRRGFAHGVFEWANGYRLHVIGAHLKSKVYHRLGQTDMRRYEARRLRYRVNDIIEDNPEANVLILGDMNDSPQSSPIKSIIYRRFGTEKELFDLRPADTRRMLWTHYWDKEDTYTRIDYAFATYHLLPEIHFDNTVVAALPYWRTASDHRPLLVVIAPHDAEPARKIMDMFHRNFRSHPFNEHRSQDGRIAPQAR